MKINFGCPYSDRNNGSRALLDAGADINGQRTYSDGTTGDTALAAACFHGHAAAVDALLEAGADVDLAGTHPRFGAAPLAISGYLTQCLYSVFLTYI